MLVHTENAVYAPIDTNNILLLVPPSYDREKCTVHLCRANAMAFVIGFRKHSAPFIRKGISQDNAGNTILICEIVLDNLDRHLDFNNVGRFVFTKRQKTKEISVFRLPIRIAKLFIEMRNDFGVSDIPVSKLSYYSKASATLRPRYFSSAI